MIKDLKFSQFVFWQTIILTMLASFINAQEQNSESSAVYIKQSECTSEMFENADKFFRMRKSRNDGLRVKKEIEKILKICSASIAISELKKHLKILDEEIAKDNFFIGNYYWERAKAGSSGIKGAQARFREIIEGFPHYSKIDKVMFLLGETYFLENDFDEAKKYYQRVINEFPESEFIYQSESKLELIEQLTFL